MAITGSLIRQMSVIRGLMMSLRDSVYLENHSTRAVGVFPDLHFDGVFGQ